MTNPADQGAIRGDRESLQCGIAHVALGAAYVEMTDFGTPMEFLASLATAEVIGHHWDEPRPWSSRVVPSVT